MESALYGIYTLVVFVSEISLLVRCAHSFDFWYVNNSFVNTVRQHFPWSILYRALRALFLNKQSSYKAPLDKGDLITLQNRRLKDIAILMYKVKHKLCLTKISELFHMHCTPYNLRVAVFAIPRFKTKKYDKHSLTYLGPKLRNRLSGEIRTLPTSTSFKHRVQKCDLKCTWPVIGYTRIWYTGTSFLLKRLTGVRSLSPLTYPFVVVFFSAYIFLRLPHDLNACNRLLKTRLPYFRRAETWRL